MAYIIPAAYVKNQSSLRSFLNHRPSAATPGVAGGGNSDLESYSAFSIAPRGGERRANAQSDANHLRCGARNNNGNTIGTSRADRLGESNLYVAIPKAVAMRLRRINSTTRELDPPKASPA